jgi:transcriptional regulator with XRE-family HTH domain
MPAAGKPTVRSRRLGSALRAHRLNAKVDQADAAEVIMSSQAKLSRIESGHVSVRLIDLSLLLDAYGVRDQEERERLATLAKSANRRGWWLDYVDQLRPGYTDHISMEDDATYIRDWQPVLFPGLLQMPAYAEAAINLEPNYNPPDRVAELIKVREVRQSRIAEGGAIYTAIIWEPVIIHPLVSVDIHREQLQNLLKVGRRKNATIQILPLSAGMTAGMSCQFSSFSFGPDPVVEAVTMDNLRGTSVLEAPEDLRLYTNAFDHLRSAALAPHASARLIRNILQDSEEEEQ